MHWPKNETAHVSPKLAACRNIFAFFQLDTNHALKWVVRIVANSSQLLRSKTTKNKKKTHVATSIETKSWTNFKEIYVYMNVCRPLARLEVPEFRGPLDFDDLFDWLEASINIILTIMWS